MQRGYNQVSLIARPIAQSLHVPLRPCVLMRTGSSTKQAALSRQERLKNLDGAFVIRKANAIRGKHVLLVDDVTTTGATLEACCEQLKKGQAASIMTAVVAAVG